MEILISEDSCRICLVSEAETRSIFDMFGERAFSEIIEEWSGVKIEPDDAFSKQICGNCSTKVIELMEFRQLCIDSDDTLRYNMLLDDNREGDLVMQVKVEELQVFEETGQEIVEEYEDAEVVLEETEEYIESEEEDDSSKIMVTTDPEDEITLKMREAHAEKESRKKHQCPYCEKSFMFPSKVQRHIEGVHKDPTKEKKVIQKKHACPVCSKLFISHFKVRRHMKVHENELHTGLQKIWTKGFQICTVCDMKFHTEQTFDRHKLICDLIKSSRVSRSKDHKYICVICMKNFETHEAMSDHMKAHEDMKSFTCRLCDDFKETEKIQEIRKHGRFHEENISFACSVCDKFYTCGEDIMAHLLRHRDYRPFKCEECGKTFFDKFKLKLHKNTHNSNQPKNYVCEYCKKDFAALDYLNCHIRRMHSTEAPFSCEICHRKFKFIHNLNVHMTVHTGEKKYCCNLCDTTFARRGALKKHLVNNHNGGSTSSSLVCQICSYKTTNEIQFNNHILTHDGDGEMSSKSGMIKLEDPNMSSYDFSEEESDEEQTYELVEVQTY